MSKAKFILKEPTAKEETLIYLLYNYNYKRFKYSTGEKINPKFWNEKNQRVKETKQFPQYPEFNNRLNLIENGINTVFRKLLNNGIQPNNNNLKEYLEAELSGNIIKPKKVNLLSFVENYIKECELTKKYPTVKSYRTTYKYLNKFAETQNKNFDFESINLEFYNKFLLLLNENNLSANTIGKHIKSIKIFLNEATERGYNKNLEYKTKKFKATKEDSDSIYLNLKELDLFYKLKLDRFSNLEKVRDLFLVGCYTGLRFSDFTQIKPENILASKNMLQIRTQKTGEKVFIPLHRIVREILHKYNNDLPKAYTNQVMNRYLKEIAEMAQLDELIETTITKGGKVQKNAVSKCRLVSTHTARRSFATNLYLADVPTISIMKITGHKTEKSFLTYIKVSQEQNADKLLTHPFFN